MAFTNSLLLVSSSFPSAANIVHERPTLKSAVDSDWSSSYNAEARWNLCVRFGFLHSATSTVVLYFCAIAMDLSGLIFSTLTRTRSQCCMRECTHAGCIEYLGAISTKVLHLIWP